MPTLEITSYCASSRNSYFYQCDRRMSYGTAGSQLDMLWHAIDADEDLKGQVCMSSITTGKAIKENIKTGGLIEYNSCFKHKK